MVMNVTSEQGTSLASDTRGVHWLAELSFASGVQRITTAPLDVVVGGATYIGLGGMFTVSDVSESADASASKLNLSFSLVNDAMLAATIGNVESYRGRRVRLYIQIFNGQFQQVGNPVLRWTGYMEPVKVSRKRGTGSDSAGGKIELPCSRAGMARARNYKGLRLTHAQHQISHPTDRGLEYMQALVDSPSLWLSKRFQEV